MMLRKITKPFRYVYAILHPKMKAVKYVRETLKENWDFDCLDLGDYLKYLFLMVVVRNALMLIVFIVTPADDLEEDKGDGTYYDYYD